MAAVLTVGALVGGGAGAFFAGPLLAEMVLGPPAAAAPAAGEHGEAAAEGGHGEGAAAEGAHGEEAAEGGHGAAPSTHVVENLVLNPANSGGTRFLMLTVAFNLKDATVVEEMKARDAEVRDAVLTTLGRKTVEQLSDIAVRDSIKVEVKAAVSTLFPKGAVKGIYLPQFVIQ